jgi:hypothetical protein
MANFETLYTGRGLAPNLPQDNGKAMGRLSDFITKAEELKYSTFKQNEQEFLKNSNIDPAFFISTANQKTQSDLLVAFNNKWSGRMKASGYNMSTDDKSAMQAEHNFIVMQQQKMQADQDLWQQHRNMIMQNPTKYDVEEWSQFDKQYRTTGEYPLVTPPIAARSIDMALEDNAIVGNEQVVRTPLSQNGLPGIVETTYSGTEQQARERVKQVALMDESYTKDLAKQFTQLDEATKLKYLDADKNGIISPEEAKDFNPIIKWAQDTKWQKTLKKNEGTWKRTTTSTTATKSTIDTLVGQKRDIDVNYGGVGRPNMYSLGGNVAVTDIPTKGGQELGELDTQPVTGFGNYAKAYLKDYDADRKTIIIQITTSDPTSGAERLQLIEIPQENIPNYQNIKLNVNGKTTTIGNLTNTQTTGTTTPTKKKTFNSVTGKFEY